jgi:hypothetical protein
MLRKLLLPVIFVLVGYGFWNSAEFKAVAAHAPIQPPSATHTGTKCCCQNSPEIPKTRLIVPVRANTSPIMTASISMKAAAQPYLRTDLAIDCRIIRVLHR